MTPRLNTSDSSQPCDTLFTQHPSCHSCGEPLWGGTSGRESTPPPPHPLLQAERPGPAGFWVPYPEREGMSVPAPPLALLWAGVGDQGHLLATVPLLRT